jgi:hypothetical protein
MQECFPSMPNYPNFSVWRLMVQRVLSKVRAWIEHVFIPMRSTLDSCFFKLLANERILNLSEAFQMRLEDSDLEVKARIDEFRLRRTDSMAKQIDDYLTNADTPESVRSILKGYVTSLVDLSIHEISVYQLKLSNCIIDGFYSKLETRFINETTDFFSAIDPKKLGKNFIENFLSMDLQLTADLFLNKTIVSYLKKVTDRWLSMMKNNLSDLSLTDENIQNNEMRTKNNSSNHGINAESADINLLLQHSLEPRTTFSSTTIPKRSSEMIKQLQGQLLENMINRHIETDSEDEDDMKPAKSSEDALKKYNSCVDNDKKKQNKFGTPVMYRSLSHCTEESAESPMSEQKELMKQLVGRPKAETFLLKVS